MHALARTFHHAASTQNYIVAKIDCSSEDSIFMCEYLHLTRLPKFIVLRPESGNRFFQFPLAYRKSPTNLYKFAVEFWQDAYTQHEFVRPGQEFTNWDDWKFWAKVNTHQMLEEANGFFQDWGYVWMGWNQLFIMSMLMIFGPFLMCFQTWKTWKWVQAQKEKQANMSVEDDDEFEKDDDATAVEENKEEGKEEEKEADKKKDAASEDTAKTEETKKEK